MEVSENGLLPLNFGGAGGTRFTLCALRQRSEHFAIKIVAVHLRKESYESTVAPGR